MKVLFNLTLVPLSLQTNFYSLQPPSYLPHSHLCSSVGSREEFVSIANVRTHPCFYRCTVHVKAFQKVWMTNRNLYTFTIVTETTPPSGKFLLIPKEYTWENLNFSITQLIFIQPYQKGIPMFIRSRIAIRLVLLWLMSLLCHKYTDYIKKNCI